MRVDSQILKAWVLSALLMAGSTAGAQSQTGSASHPTATAAAPMAMANARQLWQLIDYVAIDYAGAVEGGKVVSESEYAEMLDFTQNALPEFERGRTLYATQCAACHGAAGRGDGALAAKAEPPPIAFTDAERARARSLMALYQVISQGVEGTSMASFAARPEEDRWALAFYVATLAHDAAMRQDGQVLWTSKDAAIRSRFADVSALTTTTEAAAAESLPADTARDVLAYLRSHPEAINAGKPAGLALARVRLKESRAALQAGDLAGATKLGLSAYLDQLAQGLVS